MSSSSVTSTPIKTMTPPINPHQQHSASTHSTPVRTPQPATQHSISTSSLLPVNDLDVIQEMIACSADRLEGLRTQCSTSNTLTQIEIRSLETKLLKMFSDLLLTKGKLNERLPASGLPRTSGTELRQWLRVVGLSLETINACLTRLSTLEQLMDLEELQLKELLQHNPARREEEVRRLCKAMENLKKCKELLAKSHQYDANAGGGGGSGGGGVGREQLKCIIEKLHWDSWDRHQQHHHRGSLGNIEETSSPRVQRHAAKQSNKQQQQHANLNSSLTTSGSNASTYSSSSSRQSPANDAFRNNTSYASSSSATDDSSSTNNASSTQHNSSHQQNSSLTLTLTPSPPNSPFTPTSTSTSFSQFCGGSLNGTPQKHKNAGTPPPTKIHYTALNQQQPPLTPEHHIPIPLSKSKSNESQFQDNSYSSAASTVISSPSSMAHNATALSGKQTSSQLQRTRLNTDPSPDSHSSASSDLYVDSCSGNNNQQNNNSLLVPAPMSPCTTTTIVNFSMSHNIKHRFTKLIGRSTCDFCQKAMFIGRKCKECKYRCHKDCERGVPPSCCLPPEFIEEFKNTIENQVVGAYHAHKAVTATQPNAQQQQQQQQSPNTNTLGKQRKVAAAAAARHQKYGSTASSQTMASIAADSSSPGSSCNSSSPSSPALFNLQHHHSSSGEILGGGGGGGGGGSLGGGTLMSSSAGGSSTTSSNVLSTPSSYHNNKNASQFHFPDVTITKNCNNPAGSTTETILSAAQSLNCSLTGQHEAGSGDAVSTDMQKSRNNSSEALLLSTSTTSCSSVIDQNAQQSTAKSNTETHANVTASTQNSSGNNANAHSSIMNSSASIVNAGPAPFFQRKLSSAGVDKRGNFTELSDTHKSNDSDKTVSLSGSTSASTDSDRTPVRLDSTEDGDSGNWPRQNSLSLKEWDIPYSDLQMLEQIGQGRFGTVHRALWHGSVAVKLFKEDYMDNENMLEAFKVEVANFKKTRHENLVLFMGACMNPPYLAIVTSLCKGNTLYTHIHARREKFVINKTTLIAQQITQGMGYLHARGIIHKDLRTKNIFLENGKVIITDFGLFSSTKLLYCADRGLGIPSNWLCYLAPELMRCLTPTKPDSEILPFSMASDVYSFGTVWYELLCGEFPFKSQPAESIIWQVGRGMKQTLANLQTTRDVKDILMLCWHYDYREGDRPDFPKLLTLFERLPKKRLARSPSHPVQLSRSAEAIF